MTFLILFYEFFKAGLFAIGGGLATLPFLYDIADKYTWFDEAMLSDMIAISESTPGPIGVNMATYAGYNAGFELAGVGGGILGAATATIGLITPSIIIILIVAQFLKRFKDSQIVKDVFYTLRPAVTGLIACACFTTMTGSLFFPEVLQNFSGAGDLLNLFSLPAIALFAVILVGILKLKKLHPVVFIAVAAVVGILLKF
ncbi:MAG: chromate transporter [Clostridia bacterium]|nr:chromate transporter [Clostridia bacterium]